MIEITFSQFVEQYKPVKNKYFPQAMFNGTLFAKEDIAFLAEFISKQLWSYIHSPSEASTSTNNIIVPGVRTGLDVIGYFACNVPYENNTVRVLM